MKSLYIIGNGFDIAHGLKTKYWDFREYLAQNHYEFLEDFEKLYDIIQYDSTDYHYNEESQKQWKENTNLKLWKTFEERIGEPNIDEMISFSECIVENMDLEMGTIGILDTMNSYWKEKYGYINRFSQYLKEWIETINLDNVKPQNKDILLNDKDFFFSFNYTKTLEEVYHVYKILHIHGSIDSDYTQPIMGHCNKSEIDNYRNKSCEAAEIFDEEHQSIYNAISQYLESIYKNTSFYIMRNSDFFEKLKDVEHVYVIGWSAGKADLPYIRKIAESVSNEAKWTVYYYKEKESLKNVFEFENIKADFESSLNFWNI